MKNVNMPYEEPSNEREFQKPAVSNAVIRRLPRYFRYLRELMRQGKTRTSSAELSSIMNVTASQIRQDLNCFGGFGQQGYGYNVNYLYAKRCELLGVGEGFHAIVIGAGNLGRALVKSPMFEKRGVDVIGMFDIDPEIVDTNVGGVKVYDIRGLRAFCDMNKVDIAVLTLPKEVSDEIVELVVKLGIPALWNFTGKEYMIDDGKTIVEEIHIGDSLMTLCYELSQRRLAEAGSGDDDDTYGIEAFDDFDGK